MASRNKNALMLCSRKSLTFLVNLTVKKEALFNKKNYKNSRISVYFKQKISILLENI